MYVFNLDDLRKAQIPLRVNNLSSICLSLPKAPDFLQEYCYLQERPLCFLLRPLNILYAYLK